MDNQHIFRRKKLIENFEPNSKIAHEEIYNLDNATGIKKQLHNVVQILKNTNQ